MCICLCSDHSPSSLIDSSHEVLGMPALSPTMVSLGKQFFSLFVLSLFCLGLPRTVVDLIFWFQTQGNIAKWRKKEGEKVS